jgi:DNA-directed RNA polymerase subunit RPC12/RpoP
MGFSKRLLEKIEARGASQIVDRYVCVACVRDKALKAFVRQEATRWRCDYCGMKRRSVDADDLLDRIMDGINAEYEDPANEMGWASEEGGYIGSTIDKYDLIDELEITDNEALRDEIADKILNFEWCKQDPYGLSKDRRLWYGWERFCQRVKHESHFFERLKSSGRRRLTRQTCPTV